jgi:hypothetical protein
MDMANGGHILFNSDFSELFSGLPNGNIRSVSTIDNDPVTPSYLGFGVMSAFLFVFGSFIVLRLHFFARGQSETGTKERHGHGSRY